MDGWMNQVVFLTYFVNHIDQTLLPRQAIAVVLEGLVSLTTTINRVFCRENARIKCN